MLPETAFPSHRAHKLHCPSHTVGAPCNHLSFCLESESPCRHGDVLLAEQQAGPGTEPTILAHCDMVEVFSPGSTAAAWDLGQKHVDTGDDLSYLTALFFSHRCDCVRAWCRVQCHCSNLKDVVRDLM